ncbi:MAG: acyl-CoA dehydrogenase family protein [Acidobacteria bacterium]|nr:acyl-CoA dehydrogenase family protein [Acidobacteriota bacterium]
MKSIYFGEEHEAFRKTVRLFMEQRVAPHAEAWETAQRIPREIFREMGDAGFLGILFPEELGGSGGDVFMALAFLEELPRSLTGGFVAAVTVQEFIVTGALFHQGTKAQQTRYLVPSIEGKRVGAICISEPDTGSDVAAIRTSARRDGDSWVIDGAKTWITNGVEGDFYVVAAKTSPEAGAGGISLFVFDSSLPGITAKRIRKMGWHCSDTAEITFENVRIPADALLGQKDRGFYYIMQTFALERLVAAATSVGSCDLALADTLSYMKSRRAFGKPLDRFQALRHRLADLFAELSSVRQLVYHAAWLTQQGEPAVRESSMAKLLATELNKKVADECLQFHGGFGYTEEYLISRFYRDARVATIVAGTSEIMREIIAKTDVDGVTFPSVEDHEAVGDEVVGDEVVADEVVAGEAPPAVVAAPSAPAPAPPPAPLRKPETLEELFLSLPSRLRPEKTEGFRGRYHFRFKDSAHPEWTVVIDGPSCVVERGIHGTADCEIKTTEPVYLGIENGTQNPQAAFLMGKVKVSNVNALLAYTKAFQRLF